MNMHAGLMQAILDDPGSDDLRLVFSDFLEENGESERAEFVRVQCELAKIGPEWVPEEPESPVQARHIGGNEFDLGLFAWPPPTGVRVDCLSPIGKHRDGLLVTRLVEEAEGTRTFAKWDEHSGRAAKKKAKALRCRERELLDVTAHWSGWTHTAFDGLAYDVGVSTDGHRQIVRLYDERKNQLAEFSCLFRRGFIAEVTMAAHDWLTNAADLLASAPLRQVTLTTWPDWLWIDSDMQIATLGPGYPEVYRDNMPDGCLIPLFLLECQWPKIRFALPPEEEQT